MHENFLSYIMIGLSRGLTSFGTQSRPARRSEEEIVLERGRRERALMEQANRDRANQDCAKLDCAEAEKPGPLASVPSFGPAATGSWRHGRASSTTSSGGSRLPSLARPSICG